MKRFRDWICTAASAVLAVSAAFAQTEDGLVPGETEDVEFPPCVDLPGGSLVPRNILATFGPLADLPTDGPGMPPDTS
jgi:hypothetical protein